MSTPSQHNLNKTKKIRKTNIDKKSLWEKFDNDFKNEQDNASLLSQSQQESQIECVFTNSEGKEKGNGNGKEKDTCDCCEYALFLSDEGFLTCTNRTCGVIYKVVDQGAEWRFYGADDNGSDDPTRCGMPINPLLEQSSYGCKVMCPSKSSYEMRKIRRYTEWQSMPYNEKMRYDEGQRISILADQGGIPKIIIDEAMRLHKRLSEAKSFRGLNRDGIIAATIYVSAMINNNPRTAKEIATIFKLDTTSATKGCRNAVTILNELEHEMDNSDKINLCKTTPLTFIDRYCSQLNINAELTKLCKFISQKIQKNNMIPENTPNSIASGILYFVAQKCNLNVTKRSVHKVSDVSEVTINKCFKKLEEFQDQIIPQVILNKYN